MVDEWVKATTTTVAGRLFYPPCCGYNQNHRAPFSPFLNYFIFGNDSIKCFVGSEGNTPDSINPSVVDDDEEEEGLPSPPLDEGAFFVAPAGSMELSQVFASPFPPFSLLVSGF